jgi:OHS family lactose permease-like MFS transporter
LILDNAQNNAPQKHRSKDFWGFPLTALTYFFCWQIIFGYLTLWLKQVAHLNGVEAGVIFSMMSGLSLLFQPVFGVLSDKLLFKKNLVLTISCGLILVGPYFTFVFLPLMHATNRLFVSIITGLYLSFVLSGGVSTIEQYMQRASLANKFEYAHARMGGSLGGAIASFLGGKLFLWHPDAIFWGITVSAIILTCTFLFSDKIHMENASAAVSSDDKLDLSLLGSIFKLRNFWFLCFFYIGTSALYDVFDQQFIIFFKDFFHSAAAGTTAYSYMTTAQIALEFLLMFPMPYIINKIGARNGLIAYGTILAIRIIGSALSPNVYVIVVLRLLAGFEMPLILTSIMKYISGSFDLGLFATVYAITCNFAKQISVFIFSSLAGHWYDVLGFQHTYMILGIIVAVVTVICLFGLTKEDPVQAGEVKEAKN